MMLIVRKNFRRNKQFTNYICTNSILNSKKSNKQESSNDKCEDDTKKQRSSPVLNQKTDNLSTDASTNSKANFSNSKKEEIKQRTSALQFDPIQKVTKSLVKNVAKELGGDKKKITEDLMNYIKTLDVLHATRGPPGINKTHQVRLCKRGACCKCKHAPRNDSREKSTNKIDLFVKKDLNFEESDSKMMFFRENRTLGIFNKEVLKAENQVKLKIWDDLEAEELVFQSKCPPRNYFEELINWTNEGKLWHFPIDNDQGLDKEAKISFTEHIFMEQYLEPWCPQKGPLRKFMELILIGLSKNPYLTIEEKKSHIEWFKNYFENKKKLLQELGAMGTPQEIEIPTQKQEKSS